ncbi:hypothetical protein KP509_35G066100 [Ceratopteris richardii]|uniref:Kinesin-like protein n=1 Tax=Ceratopteris richardii TaxID=49495 RepID=A0A8T2QI63_CERRI|nr:hypothetical protein KP509_35G066100 [Ceratopteris richardii]
MPSPHQRATRREGRIGDGVLSRMTKAGNARGCESRAHNMRDLAFSCPRPEPSKPPEYALDAVPLGGHTELNARKRRLRDDLETVMEQTDQGASSPGGRIMVYVRMRPMSRSEKDAGARCCVRVVNKQDVYLAEFASETDYLRLKRLKGRHFVFDAAFPDAAGQEEVYNVSTADIVEGVLQGRNGTVFCYGATGAGKTYTMLGSTQNPGVMVLALKDLFAKLRQQSREGDYVVHLSYLEVYNETVRDLLSPGRPLVLREDSKQGTVAAGLTHYRAYSADEVMALLHQGNQNRTTEPTRANETSSRSHAILQVTVEYKVQRDSHYLRRTGKLSLIDLAGSERALATDQRTIRSLEGANINRSLLALSSCINSLVEGKRHIPFRNSKLTQLLKDSLGGACQTAMIANISPSNLSFGETQNTLHWADRAKQIRTKITDVNEEVQVPESDSEQAKLLLEVQKENQQLRMQIARLQQKLLSIESSAIMAARQSPAAAAINTPLCWTPASDTKAIKHDECRAVEESLRKRIRVLEKEKESACQEMAVREEELTSIISSLQRGHSSQIRNKDDFNRMLYGLKPKAQADEQENGNNAFVKRSAFERQESSRSAHTAAAGSARRMTLGGPLLSNSYLSNAKSNQAGVKRPAAPSTPASTVKTRRSRILEAEENRQPQMPQVQRQNSGRNSKIPIPPSASTLPAPKTPTGISKEALKKRTFWDITNANSPSAPIGRCTRSNSAATPSMLLQVSTSAII